MIRAVCDANIIVSATLQPLGNPAKILHLAGEGAFELILSNELLDEVAEVLARPKLRKLTGFSDDEIQTLVSDLSDAYMGVASLPKVKVVLDDPKDNHVVAAAIYNAADYLVSGDKRHILPLKDHEWIKKNDIAVVSPTDFLKALSGRGRKAA